MDTIVKWLKVKTLFWSFPMLRKGKEGEVEKDLRCDKDIHIILRAFKSLTHLRIPESGRGKVGKEKFCKEDFWREETSNEKTLTWKKRTARNEEESHEQLKIRQKKGLREWKGKICQMKKAIRSSTWNFFEVRDDFQRMGMEAIINITNPSSSSLIFF